MAKGRLQIHTENILPIIKKWLYSDKDIFIRELISNSCDAHAKLKTLKADHGDELSIHIRIDQEKKQITISDAGVGMTKDEVEKYIAQLAFSGAQEFIDKYKVDTEASGIIGHFGLGFYSAYMVSKLVEIETLSYQEGSLPVHWSCDGGTEYEIKEGTKKERGTQVILHIDKDSEEYLDEKTLQETIKKYCSFLPFPIYVNDTLINPKAPLWSKAPLECTDEQYIDFFHDLYPSDPDPLFWIHLNVDYPFHLKGILYFPKISKGYDFSQNAIKLFCNKVFVADSCKEILPDYLAMLKGALDSPDIPLNVSRSSLQMDKAVRQISSHIAKKVADQLLKICQTDKERFLKCYPDLELIIKFGMLQDEKFYERAKEVLFWKTTKGDWITLEQYKEKYPDEKIYYTNHEKMQSHLLKLYEHKAIDILCLSSPIDAPLLNFLETKIPSCTFQRLDGALDETILDRSREKTLLDAEGKTEAVKIADYFKNTLSDTNLTVEAKSLQASDVPAILIQDENHRRLSEILALKGSSDLFPTKSTFVVNTNSKLIQGVYALGKKSPEQAKELALHVYDLATLTQKEITPERLANFLSRSGAVLEALLETP